MKTQAETNPAFHQESHEMLMRLLKVAELLNKGNRDQQATNRFVDQTSSQNTFVEKERQKP
ncbi:MAG: hypothetical protein L6Q98_16895 [Anaerolineae bacterium]|jgi:hypothetical protein|nr:hypothetical protein [Anaerolineae bacterium]MCK6579772.1 hypothetical protein [Anaerolineae bacterium]NUQ03883.1 hypothetical protein [Anaerolineae bacterium]